jgi:hypothetical protein
MKDDIFQKKSRFYYSTTAEWNVLILWYVAVLMGVITLHPHQESKKKGQQLIFFHIVFGGVVCDDVKFVLFLYA